MATATFRPSGNASGSCSSGLTAVGAASVWQALADNSDSSYGELVYNYHSCGWNMTPSPAWTLPAYAQVRSLNARIRWGDTSGNGNYNYPNGSGASFNIQLGGFSMGSYNWQGYSFGPNPNPWPQNVIRTDTFSSAAVQSYQAPITQSDLDAMIVVPTLARLFAIGPLSPPQPRIYEFYVDVVYNMAPVLTFTAPGATVTGTTRPTLIATYTDTELDTCEQYKVKVFTQAQTLVAGFDPEFSTGAVWDSGALTPVTPVIAGSAITQQVGVDLSNNTTYVAYMKASDVGSNSRFGAWASTTFTVAVALPASPLISSIVPDSVLNRVAINLQGQDNELTRNQANAETSANGLFPQTNVAATQAFSDGVTVNASPTLTSATANFTSADVGITVTGTNIPGGTVIKSVQSTTSVTMSANASAGGSGITITLGRLWPRRQTTQFLSGVAAFVMRTAASGTVAVRTVSAVTTAAILKEAIPVKASTQYTAMASFRQAAVAAGRTARVDIAWYDSTGTVISTITSGTAVALTSTTWTGQQATLTATSPSNAAYAVVILNVLGGTAANEDTYFDSVGLNIGSGTTWTRGGVAQNICPALDSFNRADSASSLGTADLGGAWTAGRGTWGIQSNKAYIASATNGTYPFAYLTLPELVDGSVQCDVTLSNTRASVYMFMRGRSSSPAVNIFPDCVLLGLSVSASGPTLAIGAIYAGAAGSQANSAPGFALGQTIGLKLECIGATVNCYFDRKDGKGFIKSSTITLTTAEMGYLGSNDDASMAGIAMNWDTSAPADDGASRFDNFLVNGITAPQQIIVERSSDGGRTWQSVRSAYLVSLNDPGQFGTAYDYESPRGSQVLWRAKTQVTEGTDSLASPYSAVVGATLLSDGNEWLKSPSDPTKNMPVPLIKDSFGSKSNEDITIFEALGRADPLIHGGTVRYEEFDGLEFFCANDAQWRAFELLRKRQEPLLLQTCYGDITSPQFLTLTGASGSYAWAADSSALDIIGDIDLRAWVNPTSWAGATQDIVAKWVATANQRSYRLHLNAGFLVFSMTTDGSTIQTVTSNQATALIFGPWVRVTRIQATGIVRFWTSYDNVTWTQIGTDQVLAATSAIFSGSAPLEIGGESAGTAQRFTGSIYAVEVRNTIDGSYSTIVAAPYFNGDSAINSAGQVLDDQGNTFTVVSPASITYGANVDEDYWLRLGPARTVARLTMSTAPGQLRRIKIPARQVLTPSVP